MVTYALRKLKIERYRSVEGPVELSFTDGPVFLLGQNGAGKTTLLKLLNRVMVCDIAGLIDEGDLCLEWTIERGGPAEGRHQLTVRVHSWWAPASQSADWTGDHETFGPDRVASRRAWEVQLQVSANLKDSSPSGPRDVWSAVRNTESQAASWELRFHSSGAVAVSSEIDAPVTTWPSARPTDPHFLSVWLDFLLSGRMAPHDPARSDRGSLGASLWYLTAAITGSERPFDEALATYRAISLGQGDLGERAKGRMTQAGLEVEFVPLDVAARMDPADPGNVTFIVRAGRVEWLDPPPPTVVETLSATWLGADRVDFDLDSYDQDETGARTWTAFPFAVHWPGGLIHQHSSLSFGQKRLVAFLWYATVTPEAPIFTDELTNGLHAGWVRQIVDWLGDRQAFHAIQNPLLLDRSGPGARESLEGRFVFCHVNTREGKRRWSWRNPTAAECDTVWGAWETGFQQLSEVLLSEGLW